MTPLAHAAALDRALRFLEQAEPAPPSLAAVARAAGLSPRRFQQVFTSWTGLSPECWLQFDVAEWARAQRAAGRPGGATPAASVTVDALPPSEAKAGGAGLEIAWGWHPTPFGECLLAQTARGLCGLRFTTAQGRAAEMENFRRLWPNAVLRPDPAGAAATLGRVFPPAPTPGPPLRLLLSGTVFQQAVWEALLRIPEGRVVSYGAIAQAVGRPRAVRAVGTAVGANPVAYLIPCHRVLRGNWALGGYAYGPARKRLMLACEAGRSAAAP